MSKTKREYRHSEEEFGNDKELEQYLQGNFENAPEGNADKDAEKAPAEGSDNEA